MSEIKFNEKYDRFGGIIINFNDEHNKSLIHQFETLLNNKLIPEWNEKPPRGAVWFIVPLIFSAQILPVLHKNGWKYHNACGENASLVKWMNPKKDDRVPEFSRARVGVGGVVVDWKARKVLMIQEKYATRVEPFWKLPGGNLERGEDLWKCAEREIFEETGVKSKYFDFLGFRYLHEIHWRSQDDMYFILIMEGDSEGEIKIEEREVNKCQWISFDKYFSMKNEEISFQTNKTNIKIRESFREYVEKGRNENGEKLVDIQDVSWKLKNFDLKSIWYKNQI